LPKVPKLSWIFRIFFLCSWWVLDTCLASRDTQYWRDRWKARLDLHRGSRMQLKRHTYRIWAWELSPQIVWWPMWLSKIDQVYVRSSMECMWGALCDGYVGSSAVMFLTFPKDSMECHTISGYECGVQLSFEPMSRAFHLSLLYYVSMLARHLPSNPQVGS
jgi:hypothetical protein